MNTQAIRDESARVIQAYYSRPDTTYQSMRDRASEAGITVTPATIANCINSPDKVRTETLEKLAEVFR